MAKKYYVVWSGRKVGIFTSWEQCKAQVDGFSGAKYKSFPTLDEAESAFGGEASVKTSKQGKPGKATNGLLTSLSQDQITDMPFDIKIFTDGACEPNPGEAGTGLSVYKNNELTELWYGLYQSSGTNNTAELHGLNQALLLAKEKMLSGLSVAILCDSRYSIDCVTKWAKGWEKKGWTRPGGEIKNLDIIKPAYALYQEISSKITIFHVNGHIGIEGNELADRMSIIAIKSREEGMSLYSNYSNIDEILSLRSG